MVRLALLSLGFYATTILAIGEERVEEMAQAQPSDAQLPRPRPTLFPKATGGGGRTSPKSGGGSLFGGFLPKSSGGSGGLFGGNRGGSPATPATAEAKRPVWQPKVQSTFQIVLAGILDLNAVKPAVAGNATSGTNTTITVPSKQGKQDVDIEPGTAEIFDFDLFENTKETIDLLHKKGKKVICYFSAGTSEEWRPDFKEFNSQDLGAKLPMWKGERWLDIRQRSVWSVMQKRIALAAKRGCDAVDPDNVDGYDNEKGGGFKPPLSRRDAVTYVRKLAREAAAHGMSTGLKNAAGILRSIEDDIHFAVNEECAQMEECNVYDNFVQTRGNKIGKPVFHIEYVKVKAAPRRSTSVADNVGVEITNAKWPKLSSAQIREKMCLSGKPLGGRMSTVIKEMNLNGWVMYCDGKVHTTNTKPGNTGPGPASVPASSAPEAPSPAKSASSPSKGNSNPAKGASGHAKATAGSPTRGFHEQPEDEAVYAPQPEDIDFVAPPQIVDSDLLETVLNPDFEASTGVWEADVSLPEDEQLDQAPQPRKGAGKDRRGRHGPIAVLEEVVLVERHFVA